MKKTQKPRQLKRVEDHEERKDLAKRKWRLLQLSKTRKLTARQYRELHGPLYFEDLTYNQVKKLHNDAFSILHQDSRKKYVEAGRPLVCLVCGYNIHVDVCHLKRFAKFPETATVTDMNNRENLVALCRNHHWEQEHGHRIITNHWTTEHYDFFETSVVGW